ncbi:MAG: hypothetical protein ACREIC_23830, partial [Limisphaerales bacterium]
MKDDIGRRALPVREPRRGDLLIGCLAHPPIVFVFRWRGRQAKVHSKSNSAPPNNKNNGGMRQTVYKQVTPTGFPHGQGSF